MVYEKCDSVLYCICWCEDNVYWSCCLVGLKNGDERLMALRLLVSLLPVANRDTLWVLLSLLRAVVENSSDQVTRTGVQVSELSSFFVFCSVTRSDLSFLLYSVLSYSVLLCSVLWCCPILSYPILSYPVLAYPVLSHPIIFCLIPLYFLLS